MIEINIRVLICGDREWEDEARIESILKYMQLVYKDITVIHGAARGADRLGGIVAKRLGLSVEEYPAEWDKYGRAAGPIRNQQMIDTKPDLVLAFHSDIENSKGTKDCIGRAKKQNIMVMLYA